MIYHVQLKYTAEIYSYHCNYLK